MKKIHDGIYVIENNDYRKYVIEAGYSEHIKSVTSHENSSQEIELRENAPVNEIFDLISSNDFYAKIAEDGSITVQTKDPVKLVKLLCDRHYIDIEQAIAIIAHEIEHIKNPAMRALVSGRKRLKEVREVVIQNKLSAQTLQGNLKIDKKDIPRSL